jgi:UDP-N-acetylmuramoyl-tripeptide--D-alanyl-D-alanine ligase
VTPWTLAEVAAAVGGTVGGPPGSDDVVLTGDPFSDSRAVVPGGLFVAVTGTRVDGHDFVSPVMAAGAAAALVVRPVDAPHVLVDDVVAALGRLARHVVDRFVADGLVVVGLTGSSGKTTTKDLLAQVLAAAGPTVAPEGSLNTEVGVPLTALRVDEGTRFLVVEMGARGPGHIATLCEVTPPHLGVVLNIGSAHVGEFGSREVTARSKAELVAALPAADAGGVAVLNADDPLVRGMAPLTRARVVLTGTSPDADVRASDVVLDRLGRPSYVLHLPHAEPLPVTLGLHGAHLVANSLAVAAVALECGLTPPAIARALAEARVTSRWRMEVTERADGTTVVNDAYNANPESMRAALEALAVIAEGRRSWAVLGEMLELGAASTAQHKEVGRLAREVGVDRLVAVGEGAAAIHAGAVAAGAAVGEESVRVADAAEAEAVLRDSLEPGDVVLVKASRGIGLERVAKALLAQGAS